MRITPPEQPGSTPHRVISGGPHGTRPPAVNTSAVENKRVRHQRARLVTPWLFHDVISDDRLLP
jgi:hypothetical protein